MRRLAGPRVGPPSCLPVVAARQQGGRHFGRKQHTVLCRLSSTAAVIAAPSSTADAQQLLRQLSALCATEAADCTQAPPPDYMHIEQLLDGIYEELDAIFYSKGGYVLPPKERNMIDATGGSATYGEILAEGVQHLLDLFCMDNNSVFCDLGSGRGRAVLQVAMTANIHSAVGLELSSSRLEQAEMALDCLRSRNISLTPTEFRYADLASCSLDEGSHFYLCSTAYSSGLCRSIAQRLADSSNFKVLVTSRQLPTQPYLYLLGDMPCQYSFTAAGRCYVYVKSLQEAPLSVLGKFLCRNGICWLPNQHPGFYLAAAVEEELAGNRGSRYITLQQQQQQQQRQDP